MDCIEEIMKLIPDWSIDCIITDPPYWTTACKRDTVIPFWFNVGTTQKNYKAKRSYCVILKRALLALHWGWVI